MHTCPWEAPKEGHGDLWALGKDKRYQLHSPRTPNPSTSLPPLFSLGVKSRSTETICLVLIQGPVPSRSMNWSEIPKPQFLYLQNGDNKRTCVLELERLEITYKVLSTIPRHRKCPSNIIY